MDSAPVPLPLTPDSPQRQVSKSHFKDHSLELLRGSVRRFDEPFAPVGENDWEALA